MPCRGRVLALALLSAAAIACQDNARRSLADAGGAGTVGQPTAHDASAVEDTKQVGDAGADRTTSDVTSAPAGAALAAVLGARCSQAADCLAGNCAGGVCCNIVCEGPCVSCTLPGRLGTCSPISAGARDPRGVCVDQGAASCGDDGTCDGLGGCSRYAAGVTCADASSCSGTLWSGVGRCDGTGTCQRQTLPCLPYACDPQTNACHVFCTTADDCAPGEPCVNGACGNPQPGSCSTDAECPSGFCAQGACCNTKCDGPCSSCALPGTIGTCMPVANPPDAGACGP